MTFLGVLGLAFLLLASLVSVPLLPVLVLAEIDVADHLLVLLELGLAPLADDLLEGPCQVGHTALAQSVQLALCQVLLQVLRYIHNDLILEGVVQDVSM